MVKISGADFTAEGGAGNRTTERAGEKQKPAVSGAGFSAVSPKTAGPVHSAGFRITPQTVLHLAHTLGLPQDKLSASIISFARYFSLPLNPGLLAQIRRESLSLTPEDPARAEEGLSPKGRETGSFKTTAALAAAAAAAKGVTLSRGALEKYAAAADPEYPAKNPESRDRTADSGGNSGGGGSYGSGSGGRGREQGEGSRQAPPGEQRRTGGALNAGDAAGADTLRDKIISAGERDPLLNLLNRLPGKNGQRWIVIPFSVANEAGEFRVSLRILLHEAPSGGSPGRLALDISGGDKNGFRWLFIFDKPPMGDPRLQARLWPPEGKKSLDFLKKELSRLLSLQQKQIILQNDGEFFLFETDYQDNVLPSVNKEV
jgi:hypothetical protein